MESNVTTAAVAFANAVLMQGALSIVNTMGAYDYLNPYDACVFNYSQYDFIVIGGGTSGCVLANRLSENAAVSVLLIEAGENFPYVIGPPIYVTYTYISNTNIVWNYTAEEDENYRRCHRDSRYEPPVAKVLGGTSSIDYMLYSQGTDRDYNTWASITNEPSWLYPNVLRLFKKVERFRDAQLRNSPDQIYHGFNGKVALVKDRSPTNNKYYRGFNDIGVAYVDDINNNTKLGVTGAIYYIDDIRENSALTYVTPVRIRPNLSVLKNSQVTKIIFNKNKKAVAVKVFLTQCNKTIIIRVNKEIIVAAGTFNTPKLLQLSGIGPRRLLNSLGIPVIADLPVGENYQNHLSTIVVGATQSTSFTLVPQDINPTEYPSPTVVSYSAVNRSNPYPEYITYNFIVTETPPEILLGYATYNYRFINDIVDTWYRRSIGREVMYTRVMVNYPQSRGSVRIRSRNPFTDPIIETGYYSDEIDIENMVQCVKDFVRIYNGTYFEALGAFFIDPTEGSCGSPEVDGDDFWRCYVRCLMYPMGHHVGTAAMGSVLDGRMRVNGVVGLRVVDASAMPYIISDSITIPVMMMAENAAEMIKEDNNITVN